MTGDVMERVNQETGMDPTAVMRRDTITEIVSYRNAAVAEWERFFAALDSAHRHCREARKLAALACGGDQLSIPYAEHARELKEFQAAIELPDTETLAAVARRLTDISVWWSIVRRTQLESLMDKTAKDELRNQMRYIPIKTDRNSGAVINQEEISKSVPPVTEETILSSIEGFRQQADMIWKRGIAEAFTKLDRRFRSHDGFKIGGRIILSRAFDDRGSWNHYARHDETLFDIERVFLILDGKKPTMPYASVVEMIREQRHGGYGRRQSRHLGDYFEIRIFKNGNAHLWFRREDLVEKVNKELAEYYGAGLGWGRHGERDGDPFTQAVERSPAKNFGLFPTPDDLADRVIERASLYSETPLDILEPSAGTGQLSKRALEHGARHRVDVVEIQPELAVKLRAEGVYATVYPRDFLTMQPTRLYDRVVMNPPFDMDRDIDHVWHAMRFVKPGGILVAIMSASTEWAESAKARKFREELARNWKSRGWRGELFEDLPARSFAECGANVNTALLAVTRVGG